MNQEGGKAKKQTTKKVVKKVSKKSKDTKTKPKKKMNAFFTAMLEAKAKKAPSFEYKGNTYKGHKHDKLGMIYKKA